MKTYVVISLLSEEDYGLDTFEDPPLHVTISNIFFSDLNPETILDRITNIKEKFSPFKLEAVSREKFGENGEFSVTELKRTDKILKLHQNILDTLDDDITLKNPEFAHEHFRPHVTDQKSGKVDVGDTITITNLTLVELMNEKATIHKTLVL